MATDDAEKLQPTRERSLAASRHTFQFLPGGEEAVFPIIKGTPEGVLEHCGTGFFVGPSGLFATAAHVFEGRDVGPDDEFSIIQSGPDHLVLRSIERVAPHPDHDVALGWLGPAHDGCEACSNHSVVAIMRLDPEKGELVGSFVFSHTIVHDPATYDFPDGPDKGQRTQYRSHWEMGISEEVYPDGLGNLSGRCFGTSVFVEGRASGGPLFNSNGFVIGLNNIGFAEDEGLPHSTATSIRLLGEIDLGGRTLWEIRAEAGGHRTYRPTAGRVRLEHPSWDDS